MRKDESLLDLVDLVSFDGMSNKLGGWGFDSLHRCKIRLACTGHMAVLTIVLLAVHCQYITLRLLGDNPPTSYVFLPSLF